MKSKKTTLQVLLEILLVSTKLGFTSFGGPIAHLGYFHKEYVHKKNWITERNYADLVALCQFLPGPASSQVGMGIGIIRGGVLGGIVSFIGFTLPSVLALIVFALVVNGLHIKDDTWIHGLKIVAVVVVAEAIIGMSKKLTPDLKRKTIALLAIIITLLLPTAYTHIVVIILSGIIGYIFYKEFNDSDTSNLLIPISKRLGAVCLFLFFGLLLVLPILNQITTVGWIDLFDRFYRSGALVFGGGHVVLPLLEQELVTTDWISNSAFLTGYGAAQAVPGPLFTFAAYLGTVISGWQGGVLATIAIFLPAFLLIYGTMPFWNSIRTSRYMNGAFMGINAAVVGILISSFYQPIWTSTILSTFDFVFAAILYTLLVYWKIPPWIIVVIGGLGGFLLSFI
ncbi:chromate efflux transporter [Bacillus sp. B1-b2]|uniref:chromate efflux transporter n=1 Tax=Bacillus sp. B1-b2 TaxID=2653201 RepID=UPI001261D7CF|nr:chromate efflux transporter [Bacillus sp. B1-b2]KAB7665896.1 chromate efflux transporter [Bacillus sp. B1-b2]